MADTIIKTKTYGCTCGYRYSYVDDSQDLYSDYYTTKLNGLTQGGYCASCKTQKMGLVLDSSEQSTHIVADDNTLAATLVPEIGTDGQPVMVQVGESPQMQVDPSTGAISWVMAPVYGPNMVPVDQNQLNTLIAQRDNDQTTLEANAA